MLRFQPCKFLQMSFYRYSPVPFQQVRVEDTFWYQWQCVNHEHSLPRQYDMCRDTGRFDALRLDWTPRSGKEAPHIYWDSDTAKWLEAACYACQIRDDEDLRRKIDDVTDLFIRAQQPDGYLNSHFTVINQEQRWKNLRDNHELYCAGHIMEAAVAHHTLTGSDALLRTARHLADCIDRAFGPRPGQMRGYGGHQEIELALVRLYQATDEERYLRLAAFFINERGRKPYWFDLEAQARGDKSYYNPLKFQSHLPVREQADAVGHAVRAMYFYAGVTDVAAYTGDAGLLDASLRLWDSLTRRRLYITGGLGSSWFEEKLTFDFDLPNERAYCETCASVALVLWAQRMLRLEADSRYAEVLERTLYNAAIAGMSLDGRKFFYQNPLASHGHHRRQEWFECSCCPSNLSRLLGSLGSYIAMQGEDTLALCLYIGSDFNFSLGNGVRGTMRVRGDMPWGSPVMLTLAQVESKGAPWTLRLRIPEWSRGFSVTVNGREEKLSVCNGHVDLTREWKSGDELAICFTQPVVQLVSDPRVFSNSGQVALQRGPFVYCVEDADYPGLSEGVYGLALSQRDVTTLKPAFMPDLLGGITVIEGQATAPADPQKAPDTLYRPLEPETTVPSDSVPFRGIPYYAWENRVPGAMRIWLPRPL
jgi:DUF1680 family protein